jgi:hypothetical protein
MRAKVFLSIATKLTFATKNRGVERNSLAYHLTGHVLTNSVNDTGRFMTHNKRRNPAPSRSCVTMYIAATDSTCSDSYPHLTRVWLGRFKIGDRKSTGRCQEECFHDAQHGTLL